MHEDANCLDWLHCCHRSHRSHHCRYHVLALPSILFLHSSSSVLGMLPYKLSFQLHPLTAYRSIPGSAEMLVRLSCCRPTGAGALACGVSSTQCAQSLCCFPSCGLATRRRKPVRWKATARRIKSTVQRICSLHYSGSWMSPASFC
jgi:hypothetical protein